MIFSNHVLKRLTQLVKIGHFDSTSRWPGLVELDGLRVTITVSDQIGLLQAKFREHRLQEPREGSILIDFASFYLSFLSRYPAAVPVTFDIKDNQLLITDTQSRTLAIPALENFNLSGWEYEPLQVVKTVHYDRLVQSLAWLLENLPRSAKLNVYADYHQLRIYSVSQEYELGITSPGLFFNGQYMATFNENGIEALRRVINFGVVQAKGSIIFADRGIGLQTKISRLIFDAEYINKEPLNLSMEPLVAAKFDMLIQDLSQTKYVTLTCNSQNRIAVLKNDYVTLPGKHIVGDLEIEIPSILLTMLGKTGPLVVSVVKDDLQRDVLILRKSGRYLAIPLSSQLLSNPTRNLNGSITLNLSRPAVKRR